VHNEDLLDDRPITQGTRGKMKLDLRNPRSVLGKTWFLFRTLGWEEPKAAVGLVEVELDARGISMAEVRVGRGAFGASAQSLTKLG
jgi:hypothetical protein